MVALVSDFVGRDPVGAYLADLMAHVLRASPGPLTTSPRRGSSFQVTSASVSRPVATFGRQADAQLYARAVPDLRALASVVAELVAGHHDDGKGRCASCGESAPCRVRHIIDAELAPRATP
jgi:hypothetical protein